MTTFKVGARVGRRALGWPFGRLTIEGQDLRLVSWPVQWIGPIVVDHDSVRKITILYKRRVPVLYIEDEDGAFGRAVVELPARTDAIVNELRQFGYVVIDER